MSAGDGIPGRVRPVLIWIALVACLTWCVAIGATAVRVHQVRAELVRLAADVAHHNGAHHARDDAGSSHYLDMSLRTGIGRQVRSASVRVVRIGGGKFVEVRVRALVGFAILGHPKISITVVRSAPVE